MESVANLRFADQIQIASRTGPGELDVPRGEIVLSGTPTGCLIAGPILEAAVVWQPPLGSPQGLGGRYLLLTSDGIDFEDALNITLLSLNLELLDRASLGVIYGSGTFKGISLRPPNRLRFGWGDCQQWELEFLLRPRLGLPWVGEVRGLSRPRNLRRWFRVCSVIQPDVASAP